MRLHLLLYVFSIFFLTVPSKAVEIQFESDVQVKKNSGQFENLKTGDVLSLSKGDSAITLNSRGLPVLIVDPLSSDSKLVLHNSDMQNILNKQISGVVNNSVNEIIEGLRKVESFLQKRDYAQAQALMAPLRSQYDSIAAVLFLNASVSYLSNNKAQAVEDLEKGLKIDSQNQAAQKLLQKIKESR